MAAARVWAADVSSLEPAPECAQLGVDSLQIRVEQIVEQVALVRADLLAALGKPMPLEDGNLVGQLLNDGLIAMDLSAHGVDLRHQLRR